MPALIASKLAEAELARLLLIQARHELLLHDTGEEGGLGLGLRGSGGRILLRRTDNGRAALLVHVVRKRIILRRLYDDFTLGQLLVISQLIDVTILFSRKILRGKGLLPKTYGIGILLSIFVVNAPSVHVHEVLLILQRLLFCPRAQ